MHVADVNHDHDTMSGQRKNTSHIWWKGQFKGHSTDNKWYFTSFI